MNSRLFKIGIALIILAGLSWLAEILFIEDLDTEGVSQESIFLPLALMWGLLGVVFLFLSGALKRK
jgi:hypothetical protein